MERLTQRVNGVVVYVGAHNEETGGQIPCEVGPQGVREILARMVELMIADKEGRMVVLPCKVGDVVYGFHNGQAILPMVAKWVETSADGWTVVVQYAPMAPKSYLFSDFGKTVFRTREEAEEALMGAKHDQG